jgi:hypothetical protein
MLSYYQRRAPSLFVADSLVASGVMFFDIGRPWLRQSVAGNREFKGRYA